MLFVDVVQSTELTERVGDLEAYRRIGGALDTARAAAACHRGEELEVRGDGILFAYPCASDGVACASGIRLALRRSTPRVRVRMGLHIGDAIRIPTGYFGLTVIFAARLTALARSDEILVSEAVREEVAGEAAVEFEASRRVRLKGLRGQHQVSGVAWREPRDLRTAGDALGGRRGSDVSREAVSP